MKRPTNPNARFLIAIAILSAVLLASAASWTLAKSKGARRQATVEPDLTLTRTDNAVPSSAYPKAELVVSNLSCGGCIETIPILKTTAVSIAFQTKAKTFSIL